VGVGGLVEWGVGRGWLSGGRGVGVDRVRVSHIPLVNIPSVIAMIQITPLY
jgi:hypothetical protein